MSAVFNLIDCCDSAYLNYLHLDLHDEKETNVGSSFQQIFEFIREACLPDVHDCALHAANEHTEYCQNKASGTGESNANLRLTSTPRGTRELPVSNQVLEINFKNHETHVKTGV